ncbi:Transcription initiation factor TFIID subunit 13 [Rhizina undulata]
MATDAGIRRPRQRRQQLFVKELRSLMYAFGDDPEPLPESVSVLDEIVTEYIVDMCHDAARMALQARRNKIKVDDFKFALRRDPKKLGRVEELLVMSKVIAEARKQFDDKQDVVEGGK